MIKSITNLESQIQLKDFKLNSLLELTKAINTNQSTDKLVELFNFIVKNQLGYDKFILFMKKDEWTVLIKTGIRTKIKEFKVEDELLRFKEITLIESSKSDLLNHFDAVVPVFHKEKPLAYLLVEDNVENRNTDQTLHFMGFLQTLANIIAVAIENKRMAKLNVDQERFKKELEVASAMQRMLFPDELPTNKKMDISAKYKPRHEVGGDYYDFIPIAENEYVICIADVSGKGISAAMIMANFQATIRTLFEYQKFDLKALVKELNDKVMKSTKGEKFITFFLAHYNTETRKLTYINAGHNHPFITNGKTYEDLSEGCIGLGMLDELPFINVGNKELSPNTTMVLYTDGVVELENYSSEFFGTERLVNLVKSYYPLNMDDMNSLIFSKLDEWKGELNYVDDTAIFSCRFF